MADHLTPERRLWNMSRIRNKNTKPELVVRSLLHHLGYRFTVNGPKNRKLPGKPDMVLPKHRTVVFVHGCFWHRHRNCKETTTPKTRTEWWQTKFDANVKRDRRPESPTTATMAYEQGATGVRLFNFPYYRYHVTDDIGPFHEPPFHVLPKLKDRDFLNRQDPSYFLSSGRKDRILGERTLPAIMNRREDYVFEMPVSQTMDITTDGILRLRSDENIEDREFKVSCGEHILEEIEFIEEPFPHSYDDAWLGTAEDTRCFSFPKEALDGKEAVSIAIRILTGIRVRLIYMDLTFPKT